MIDHAQTPPCAPVFQGVNLAKEYEEGKVRALRGVNFTINEGEFVAILGRSGSGKSTLLQMLGALDMPTSGALYYRGHSLAEHSNLATYRALEIGFIFQSFHLLNAFTAAENVQMPMFSSTRSLSERRERAHQLLTAVGLGHRMDHFPSQMSGGERQRVAIARSLANNAKVLLADEPTGNLDTENAKQVLELITSFHQEQGMTIVMVTHDAGLANLAPRAITMGDGQILSDCATSSATRS